MQKKLLCCRLGYYKEFKRDNERMVKHINVLEKDLEILKRKYELLQMDNSSLKNKLEILNAGTREASMSSRYLVL